jgi:hypothetical protein
MHRPGYQAVDLAPLEHHRADRDRVGQVLACHLLGPAFVPAKIDQQGNVALGDGTRIDHRDVLGQVQAELQTWAATRRGPSGRASVPRSAHRPQPGWSGLGPLRQDDQRVSGSGQLRR